jgi:hypothetical protein
LGYTGDGEAYEDRSSGIGAGEERPAGIRPPKRRS